MQDAICPARSLPITGAKPAGEGGAGKMARLGAGVGMLLMIGCVAYLLYGTPLGEQIRRNHESVRSWISTQCVVAPLLFVAAYTVVGISALPVWWMQIVAGYCFGLWMGVVWCHLGALVSSTISVQLTKWLVGESLTRRLERYQGRLGRLQERLGHSGLLVVTAVRVSHFMPFGISNYLFGAMRLRMMDVIVGTVLGGSLSKMIHVALGANPRLLASPRFLAELAAINLLLVSPLLWRYLRPAAPGVRRIA